MKTLHMALGLVVAVLAIIIGIFVMMSGNFAVGGALIVVGIIAIIFFASQGKKKGDAEKEAYYRANTDIGFLHLPYKYASNFTVEFKIIDGATKDNEATVTGTNIYYPTYRLKSGKYTVEVKTVKTKLSKTQGMIETVENEETINFEIEPRKYYVLSYDSKKGQYSFVPENAPKELDVIFKIWNNM